MTFLLILIILIASIYIIKSQNIKAAIKKDIEKIIPDNQHDKAQSEQHNNYNREISRKKPVYEPNQDKQNSQPDINAKDIITEIKTIFLNIVAALKSDYYKLKNSIKEYFKEISVGKDVKHVEKTVYNGPQYNQQYQHNNEPSECKVKETKTEKKILSKKVYIIALIVSFIISIIAYYLITSCVISYIVDSHSKEELAYYAYIYGNAYGYYLIDQAVAIMDAIYKVVIALSVVGVILSAYFYVKKGEDQKYWIICFIAIGIVLGTIVFRQLLLSEIIY
ncbi:MAG: hypothetical protein E6611_07335 [Intestinibacter bartlettii]|uniref:hypothetical protein n=1 Tax=Intestinibacter bartlettii TaxID=261299 RepID=UPI00290BC931|nr:hypothetical protein [Intestinibacter bartlettii]MDU6198530.1 hypothetical protein [Intestinibacter bartlettii]